MNFPVHNLDLTKYVKSKDGQSYVYNLYAISNHYGGLGGGHYTAYAKVMRMTCRMIFQFLAAVVGSPYLIVLNLRYVTSFFF